MRSIFKEKGDAMRISKITQREDILLWHVKLQIKWNIMTASAVSSDTHWSDKLERGELNLKIGQYWYGSSYLMSPTSYRLHNSKFIPCRITKPIG